MLGLINAERKDFQGTMGVEIFNRYVKFGDSLALSILLINNAIFQEKKEKQESLIIHDVGGADGAMMLALLQVLNITARISVNEPNLKRLERYQEKTKFSQFFSSVDIFNNRIEDADFNIPPQRELILASHVLYYNRDTWLTCESVATHLFTKLFKSLRIGGTLCVILQQATMTEPASHELWEDFIYPLLESTTHGKNTFHASSEHFDAALSAYRKQFMHETDVSPDWKISTTLAKTSVPLGQINIEADGNGKYPQSEDVLKIIEFYLKGRSFDAFDANLQKRVLNVLMEHFKNNGRYEITHYNKVYSIEVGPRLSATLCSQKELQAQNALYRENSYV